MIEAMRAEDERKHLFSIVLHVTAGVPVFGEACGHKRSMARI